MENRSADGCDGSSTFLDAKTGQPYWTYDALSFVSSSVLIAGKHIYMGHGDGDVSVFRLSADPKIAMRNGAPLREMNMDTSIHGTPVVLRNVLYIPAKAQLFAIAEGANDKNVGGNGTGESPKTGN